MAVLSHRTYTDDELLAIMAGRELSQEGNVNAFSRLFVEHDSDGDWVVKLFDGSDSRSAIQLENLERISHVQGFGRSAHVTWPYEIVIRDGVEVGYRMPYAEGATLADLLLRDGSSFPVALLNEALAALDRVLDELGPSICVGDLHGGNIVLGDGGEITVIDPDAFSAVGGACCSSPLSYIPRIPAHLLACGSSPDGSPLIAASRSQDFGCMLRLYLSFLLGSMDAFAMEERVLSAYLDHLRTLPSCRTLADAAASWLSDGSTERWDVIATATQGEMERASFAAFSKTPPYRSLLESLYWEGMGTILWE